MMIWCNPEIMYPFLEQQLRTTFISERFKSVIFSTTHPRFTVCRTGLLFAHLFRAEHFVVFQTREEATNFSRTALQFAVDGIGSPACDELFCRKIVTPAEIMTAQLVYWMLQPDRHERPTMDEVAKKMEVVQSLVMVECTGLSEELDLEFECGVFEHRNFTAVKFGFGIRGGALDVAGCAQVKVTLC
jgi:hypothetical protein